MSSNPFPADSGAERPAAATRGLRAPDVEELRTLCAAAEVGSLGRAAVRLHASQPALSKRLANLEALTVTRLLERSPHGVKLTPAGRRLYPEARRLLEQSERVREVIAGIAGSDGPIRLAASHSATDALVADLLGHLNERRAIAIELVSANSTTVRDLVADGRADIGVAASRPGHTPYPGVRELTLAADEVICAVPPGHRWTRRRRISIEEFLAEPMVRRDPSSNARWTVDSVLRERGLAAAPRSWRREPRPRCGARPRPAGLLSCSPAASWTATTSPRCRSTGCRSRVNTWSCCPRWGSRRRRFVRSSTTCAVRCASGCATGRSPAHHRRLSHPQPIRMSGAPVHRQARSEPAYGVRLSPPTPMEKT
ncbi:MAG TPA: LysR family transcriptional regulator [Solirubrobacteraceae bacterium]|nr:LysR family transcriptional regulator [Solirubrobacteraceae bacterium]